MARKSELDLVLAKIDADIAALEGMRARILAVRKETLGAEVDAVFDAKPRKSHKRKPATESEPPPKGI